MPLTPSAVRLALALCLGACLSSLSPPLTAGEASSSGDASEDARADARPPFPAFDGVFDPTSGLLFIPRFTEGTLLTFQTRTGDKVWTADLTGSPLGVQSGLLLLATPVLGTDRSVTVFALDTKTGETAVTCGPIALPPWWGIGPYNFAFDASGSADEAAVYVRWRATAEWRSDFPGEPEELAPAAATVRCDRASGELDTAWAGSVPELPAYQKAEAAPFKRDYSKSYLVSEDGLHRLEGRASNDEGTRYAWEVLEVATGEKVAGFDAPMPIRFIFHDRTALIQLESTRTRPAKRSRDGCDGVVDEYTLTLQGRRPRSGKVKYDRVIARTTRCL